MTKLAPFPNHPRRLVLFGLAAGAAQMTGCGGAGGGLAGLGSGGTGSFTTGVITGLGSIIVNGVRYSDDTADKIAVDDSTARALTPGMVVAIEGSAVTPSTNGGLPTATAYRIVYGSEWKGPVSSVDEPNKRFVILNQGVDVLANTAIVGSVNQLASLVAGTHYDQQHRHRQADRSIWDVRQFDRNQLGFQCATPRWIQCLQQWKLCSSGV